jgi:DNA-binding SARP family transcriptional activator
MPVSPTPSGRSWPSWPWWRSNPGPERDLVLGRHGELAGELEAQCREYPLRERLWELLILALYRAGRQAEALRAYTEVRDRLLDELGIDPGPAWQ